MALIDEVKQMSDDDLGWALSVISQEIATRKELSAIPQKIEALNREYLSASGMTEGSAWVQPTGAHDAYPQGWEVRHNDKTWESLTPANVWEPGVSGWREVVLPEPPESEEGPSAADWVQPTGAHDAYGQDDRVSHAGKMWVSNVNGNVWEPGVYGWTAV